MLKHALAVGTLVASSLIVTMAVSAQPAGASAITQEAAVVSGLSTASGDNFIDPFNPYGFGQVYYRPFGFNQFQYAPFGYGQVYYSPTTFYRW
jgi:hypothetical protein